MSNTRRRLHARWVRALFGVRAAALLAALGLLSASCATSTPPASTATKNGGELVWARNVDAVGGLDPAKTSSAGTWWLWNLVYGTVLNMDDQLKLAPGRATTWNQPSPLSYVFNIREGVKFSNGREMTVADVIGSLKRFGENRNLLKGNLGPISSIVATGPRQMTITLSQPWPALLPALASPPAVVMPMTELAAGTFDPSKELLGTGPFKVSAHSQDESWTLARNTFYWQTGLPKIDKLTVRIMPEDAARVAALRSGSIQGTTFENPDSVQLLKGQANVKVVVPGSTDTYVLMVNNAHTSIFGDQRLRQALALAIDRKSIVSLALGGVGAPSAVVSPAFGNICPAPSPNANVQAAKQLVAAAGATGKSVSIIATTSNVTQSPIAQVLQQNLEAIGLNAKVLPLDGGTVSKRVYSGASKNDFDLNISFFFGWADPATVVGWWNPANTAGAFAWLQPDQTLNNLIASANSLQPGEARNTALASACKLAIEDANMLPLATKNTVVTYRSDQLVPQFPTSEGFGAVLRDVAVFALR